MKLQYPIWYTNLLNENRRELAHLLLGTEERGKQWHTR